MRIKAFSLVETLIAMTIIVTVSGTGLLIFNQVTLHAASTNQIKAALLLNILSDSLKRNHIYLNANFNRGGLQLNVKVEPYIKNNELQVLTLSAYDRNQKLIFEEKELVATDSSDLKDP